MWKVRFKFRNAKRIMSDETELAIELAECTGKIVPARSDQALKDASALIIFLSDLPSEEQAKRVAQRLRKAVLLWGAKGKVGIDPGNDRANSQFAKRIHDMFAESGARLVPDVHGIHIYEGTGLEDVTLGFSGTATVGIESERALSAITSEFAADAPIPDTELAALELINLSYFASDPLSKASLAISAVEMLSHGHDWSGAQKEALARLADEARAFDGLPPEEAEELAVAIERCRQLSVRSSLKRKVSELGFGPRWKEFDALYSLRSDIFHGSKRGREIHQAMAEKAEICRDIVLRAVDPGGQAS